MRTDGEPRWPELPLEAWRDTCTTLHLWTQVIGKIRLAATSLVNHWWNAPLYLTARGLTTGPMAHGDRAFQVDLDLVDHHVHVLSSDGRARGFGLRPMTVAEFHRRLMAALDELDLGVRIWTTPCELADPIPFERDTVHASYDAVWATRFWRALLQSARVLERFRAGFVGKSSPVHFFWGSFDLAVTRFSGRPAPRHPGAPFVADRVMHEAYSHEVSSAGFWPGSDAWPHPSFYAYAYPAPEGFGEWPVRPAEAFWSPELGEFLLPYDAVRLAPDPDAALLAFLESTYEAAAELGGWDRAALERAVPVAVPRPDAPRPEQRPGA